MSSNDFRSSWSYFGLLEANACASSRSKEAEAEVEVEEEIRSRYAHMGQHLFS